MRRLLTVAVFALAIVGTAAAAASSPPNDQYLSRQWYLGRDHALETFDAAKQLFTVRVAVIDSGVDLGHPELKNRVVAHRSFVGGTVADTLGHGTFVAARSPRSRTTRSGSPASRRPRASSSPRSSATTARSGPGRGARDPLGRPAGRAGDQPQPRQHARPERPERRRLLASRAAGGRVRRPARSARRRGRRQRQRRAREALALGELSGRLPARARGRGLRAPGRRADLLEPRRPLRRPGRTGDGHLLALPAAAHLGVLGLRRTGLLDLRHEGLPPRGRHLVLVAAGGGGRGVVVRRGSRAAPRPGEHDPRTDRRRRDPDNGCGDCGPGPDPLSGFGRLNVERRARRAPGPRRPRPTASSRTTTPAPRPRPSPQHVGDARRSTGGTTRTTSTGSTSRGASGFRARARRPEGSTPRSCSGSRGSTRSPTRAPTCARDASIHRPGVPSGSLQGAARAWYYLQVKLARPGFGPTGST